MALPVVAILLFLHSQLVAMVTVIQPQLRANMQIYTYNHWVGMPPDARLEMPTCGIGHHDAVWFEGHAPRRRLPTTAITGRLFNGCATFHRRSRFSGLNVVLRPDRCVGQNMSVTCLAASDTSVTVHVLQLAGDSRCPPGTARDRLGLCRRCRSSSSTRSCPQPDWETPAGCPVCDDDQPVVETEAEVDTAGASFRSPVLRLRRAKRAAVAADAPDGNSSRSVTGQVKVAQLGCPNRLWVVATVVCLLEMHYPTRGEVISLLLVAFVTIAFLCVPIYIAYVLGQIYSARFLPFLQFHIYERSALLCSSLRTQAVFAPSLWDFQAFREAEKRRRLEQDKAAHGHQVGDFRRREVQNLLLWHGLDD